MNKSSIQKFAVWARTELIAQVSQRAYQYGITEEGYGEADAVVVSGRALTPDEERQRRELVSEIRNKGYHQVMEEVAYTWFNRFIALRFMEVNNYLPSHIRVFSDSTGAFKPEILSDVLHLDLPGLDQSKVADLIEKNRTENLYRYLLLTQCNALNDCLPVMFEKMGGYTELLLPNNILRQDGIIGRLVSDIEEDDWKNQVQIIGWLYQYYNSELKDETFALLKKNVKVTKERIPSATQLFTPDWIVRYMVENSLGRLWLEGHPDSNLKSQWQYYLDEAEQEASVQAQLDEIRHSYEGINPKDIKIIDPCMGSGHILVYAFDVLMQIYLSQGYSERDAAYSILKNNLYGLDIDKRAAQLAYFAVMMKARQYDRRIFSRGIMPHVYAIVESNDIDNYTIDYFTNGDPKLKHDLNSIITDLHDATEYGSILNVTPVDFEALYARFDEIIDDVSFNRQNALNMLPLVQVAELLSQKYDVVVTNPPYMAASNMDTKLSEYVKANYPDSKGDMFAVFIERCEEMTLPCRYQAVVTQHAWMFLSSYEKLRAKILRKDIVNMAHLGARAFEDIGGEVVQTTAFVLHKCYTENYVGTYCRLIESTTQQGKQELFLTGSNRYTAQQSDFAKIPGSPVAYWVSEKFMEAFENSESIGDKAVVRNGMKTGNNAEFLRLWWEVDSNKTSYNALSYSEAVASNKKWYQYNKGGSYRKWYGNNDYVVNWENEGYRIFKCAKLEGRNVQDYPPELKFKPSLSWSLITSSKPSFRYKEGNLSDIAGMSVFADKEQIIRFLALLNSPVAFEALKLIAPTINFQAGDIARVPYIDEISSIDKITEKTYENIKISKSDWDSFETSWDFKRHPLLPDNGSKVYESFYHRGEYEEETEFVDLLELAYDDWESDCYRRFNKLKENEEELNRIFIDIYGLQDELSPEVEDKDVTVRLADKGRDVRSLISYAVGCMFGRYSLDCDGLAFAGGEWDESKYATFTPDKENIIPICDDDYFDDDITGRFVKWVETVYGKETLEENLRFIAEALGGKGTPREVIRNYFLNDFYQDHLKIYQKRPIYWLFDSGKKNGFKALVYMHRYKSDLLARMRTDYVHEQQERYRTQLAHIADSMETATQAEKVRLSKQEKKLREQALEIGKFEEKIHHLADMNIEIDLDDGVKTNYQKFGDVLGKIK